MQYKRVAYTSLAALDMDEGQLLDIHAEARDLNGIDGITGLLIFNGTHFLQWIEGPPEAIDDLVERLRGDPRHSAFEIREEGLVDERLFGDWAMELVQVRGQRLFSRENLLGSLPAKLPDPFRERVVAMAQQVAAEVQL
jgi:hypothetical protein